jgi:hypothetical protein
MRAKMAVRKPASMIGESADPAARTTYWAVENSTSDGGTPKYRNVEPVWTYPT